MSGKFLNWFMLRIQLKYTLRLKCKNKINKKIKLRRGAFKSMKQEKLHIASNVGHFCLTDRSTWKILVRYMQKSNALISLFTIVFHDSVPSAHVKKGKKRGKNAGSSSMWTLGYICHWLSKADVLPISSFCS